MSLFSQKSESYLGVDIGAHGMKLVELKKNKGRPQLWTYAIAEEPLDIHPPEMEKTAEALLAEKQVKMPEVSDAKKKKKKEDAFAKVGMSDPRVEKYADILKRAVKTANVQTKFVTASLPVSHVFHAVLTLPKVEKKEIDAIVGAEVQKLVSRPIDDMQIVHQPIPSKDTQNKYLRLLVTAAPKNLVAFYSAIFQKAGLTLRELETEAFALERSLVGRDTATVMLVDIGGERTNFFIMDQGLPMTHRSIQLGGNEINAALETILGIPKEIVNQVKHDMSHISIDRMPTRAFVDLIDPVVKEIQYGFDLFLNQSGNQGKRPEKIILTGGSALFPFLLDQLQRAFDIKVFVGDPWARVVYQQGLKPVLDTIGPRMATAIGLALRNIV